MHTTDCGASLTITLDTEPRRPKPVFWCVPTTITSTFSSRASSTM
jgi:hypothetical protein